jgi:hypothetical protein
MAFSSLSFTSVAPLIAPCDSLAAECGLKAQQWIRTLVHPGLLFLYKCLGTRRKPVEETASAGGQVSFWAIALAFRKTEESGICL